MNAVKELLKLGRTRVEKGWTKGRYKDDEGNVCALGAIGFAGRTLPVGALLARDYLNTCAFEYDYDGIVSFNDSPDVQKEDVLSLFDCAIAKASEGEV